jgi:predicted metal-dependent peptidase
LVLLAKVRNQVKEISQELQQLRSQEEQLSSMLGVIATPVPTKVPTRGARGRIDWKALLKKLPSEFRASDVRDHVGDKRASEIFAAVTRWQQAKLVKRKERGLYQRIGA